MADLTSEGGYIILGISIEALTKLGECTGVRREFTIKGQGKEKRLVLKNIEHASKERPFYVIDIKENK